MFYNLLLAIDIAYGGNNPVRYTDPDGRSPYPALLEMEESFNESQSKIFAEILRTCVGANYSHLRMPTEMEMDCSGMLVYVLDKMGYEVPCDVTADKIANDKYSWIIILDRVDNSRQGEEGIINLYQFSSKKVVHVNYVVGIKEGESDNQVIDASEGDTWQSIRNKQARQNPKAEKDKINKTWAPFSTEKNPDYQAVINFLNLKRKEIDE